VKRIATFPFIFLLFSSIFMMFEPDRVRQMSSFSSEMGGSSEIIQVAAINPSTAGTITVTGRWWYWFNTTHVLPITNAKVEIYDEETVGTVYLGSNFTDSTGYFSFGPISNDDGPGEDGLDIIVTVNATSSVARVINPTGVVYSYQTPTFENRSDGTWYISWPTSYNQRGAWWIFCSHFGLTGGWYYLASTVNYNTPTVTCRWPYGDHPCYWTNGTIDLLDWACWWPDIILHEYGHHVMNSLYGYIPPCMTEHYMRTQSNSTTAWAEGWADFFPLVVFDDPVFVLGINATHGIAYNLETPHWCSPNWDDGDEVEGRVAGALWDIFDSQDDSAPWYYDSFSDGFQRIWNIMETTSCHTFQEFWQAWNTSGYPKQPALMAMFQNTIDYRGPGDANGDCVVDATDYQLVKAHIPSAKGQPNWDKRCDVNNDDVVGGQDIQIVKANIGKSYDC